MDGVYDEYVCRMMNMKVRWRNMKMKMEKGCMRYMMR